MRSGANAMTQKGNVVLYLNKELVEKSKELGFNLSKTFENHLKHLITQFSTGNSINNFNSTIKNGKWWAEPELNRRPLARKANVLTRLDDRPIHFFKVVLRCLTYEIALVNIRILFLGGCFLLNLPAKSARNIR